MDKELERTLKSYEIEEIGDPWAPAIRVALRNKRLDRVEAILYYRDCATKTA